MFGAKKASNFGVYNKYKDQDLSPIMRARGDYSFLPEQEIEQEEQFEYEPMKAEIPASPYQIFAQKPEYDTEQRQRVKKMNKAAALQKSIQTLAKAGAFASGLDIPLNPEINEPYVLNQVQALDNDWLRANDIYRRQNFAADEYNATMANRERLNSLNNQAANQRQFDADQEAWFRLQEKIKADKDMADIDAKNARDMLRMRLKANKKETQSKLAPGPEFSSWANQKAKNIIDQINEGVIDETKADILKKQLERYQQADINDPIIQQEFLQDYDAQLQESEFQRQVEPYAERINTISDFISKNGSYTEAELNDIVEATAKIKEIEGEPLSSAQLIKIKAEAEAAFNSQGIQKREKKQEEQRKEKPDKRNTPFLGGPKTRASFDREPSELEKAVAEQYMKNFGQDISIYED